MTDLDGKLSRNPEHADWWRALCAAAADAPKLERERAIYLRVDQVRRLDHWCLLLKRAFLDADVYLVGSVLSTANHRDIDVRVVLPDETIKALPLRNLDLNYLLSQWGQDQTGLPIDCQVQSVSEHRAETGPANPRPHDD